MARLTKLKAAEKAPRPTSSRGFAGARQFDLPTECDAADDELRAFLGDDFEGQEVRAAAKHVRKFGRPSTCSATVDEVWDQEMIGRDDLARIARDRGVERVRAARYL